MSTRIGRLILALAAPLVAGCRPENDRPATNPSRTVVVYTSVDEPFARQILERFEKTTRIHVEAAFDTEAGKTSGFLRRLRREADAPRCDVWWSSEAFGTLELAADGLLAEYRSPAAADIPAEWQDSHGRWTALAARPRVLAYNSQKVDAQELPHTWLDCGDPKWRNRLVLANPQFGTTRGHVGALFRYYGSEKARGLLSALQSNGVRIADGNAQVARMVAAGEADLGWTDLDDVVAMQRENKNIRYCMPGISEELGTLWIPCTVAVLKGAPHPDAAHALADYLVCAEMEKALAESDSRNVPVRASLQDELKIGLPAPQAPDFEGITAKLPAAMDAARESLLR